MKPKTVLIVAACLVAYRIVFGAWPAEDLYRQRTGHGYFE